MNLHTGLIAILFTSALTLGCGSRTNAPTSPTDVDRNNAAASSANTSGGGQLPTIPPAQSGSCDATKTQFAIGKRASQDLLDRARVAAGADAARFVRPNDRITLEFSPARLNLHLNTNDVVQSVGCG